jgi:putative transposase
MFSGENDYQAFEKILHEGTTRAKVLLFAYCLMPNHWHLVLSPLADGHLSRFMHWVTTTHSRRWQLAHGSEGHGAVYQGRFKALPIKDDHHFLWVCRYVERNPLRAGLVERAEHWRWSTLGCGAEVRDDAVAQWPVAEPHDWTAWVNAPQTREELALSRFRDSIRTNEPFGDESWQRLVRLRMGVPEPRRRGQPRRVPPSVLNK